MDGVEIGQRQRGITARGCSLGPHLLALSIVASVHGLHDLTTELKLGRIFQTLKATHSKFFITDLYYLLCIMHIFHVM